LKYNSSFKKIIIYGYLFLFPLLGPITPEFQFAIGAVNSDMLWLFILSGLSVYLMINLKNKNFSKTFIFLILYYLFILVNAFVTGNFHKIVKTDISLYASSIFVIFLIDNLQYNESDLKRIYKVMYVMVAITLAGSLLQYFINPALFVPPGRYSMLSKIDFSGFWRNGSIFDSLMQNQSGLFFIFVLFPLLFNFRKFSEFKKVIPIVMILIAGFLTFSRYIIISQLIIMIFFLAFVGIKSRSAIPTYFFSMILVALLAVQFYDEIINSDFFQVRMLADASGRTTDPFDFFTMYLGEHNILTGTGASSYMVEFFYGNIRRYHSGIWDLFFQGGLVGLFLWFLVVYQFHKKSVEIKKMSGYNLFLIVLPLFVFINLTARLNDFFYMGFLLIYLYMNILIDVNRQRRQFAG